MAKRPPVSPSKAIQQAILANAAKTTPVAPKPANTTTGSPAAGVTNVIKNSPAAALLQPPGNQVWKNPAITAGLSSTQALGDIQGHPFSAELGTPMGGVNRSVERLPAYMEDYNRYVAQGLAPPIPPGLSAQQVYDFINNQAYKPGGLYDQARANGYVPGQSNAADALLGGTGGSDGGSGSGDGGGGSTSGGSSDSGSTGTGGPSTGSTGAATGNNDLFDEWSSALEFFGLNPTDFNDILTKGTRESWGSTKWLLEIRKHPAYAANPLFAANLNNARSGKRFMAEGEVIAYGTEAKRLARQMGYAEPSDNYLARGLEGGLSLAEYEHRLAINQRVNQFGGGVATVYRQLIGADPTDQDLYEIFDPEIATQEFDDAARRAEFRGRPLTLGLGIRSETEARALEMLGVSSEEAFSRYQQISSNAERFGRFQTIENDILAGLPANFGVDLSTQENSTLVRGFLAQGTPEGNAAMRKLQDVLIREAARHKTSSAVAGTQGQLTGLLTQEELGSYG